MFKRTVFTTVVALALVSVTTLPANAERVQFRYSTTELTTDAGARAVYSRMEQAAAEACSDNTTRPIRVQKLKERCAARLLADWVEGADNGNLNKAYAEAQSRKQYAAND